jgi:signal transduction histidine kinase
MAPVTAIVFLLFSAGILLRLRVDAPALRGFVIGSAVVVATGLALTLADVATGVALSPDRLFLTAAQQSDPLQVGRMSPFTAIAMLVLILAGLLLESRQSGRRTAGVHLALSVSVFGFVLAVGYGYGAPLLYGGSVRPVSLPTAIALLVVGLGTALRGVDSWPVAAFLGDSIRAQLTRVFVPLVAAPVFTLVVLDATISRLGMRDDPLLFSLLLLVTMAAVVTIVLRIGARTGARLDAAEAALRASEAQLRVRTVELERSNRDLEQFAYVASHDLQEPLRMVTGFTQLLQQRYEGRLDADADEFIGYALGGVKKMHDLIQELLEYARVGTSGGAFRPTNLSPVLRQVLEVMDTTIAEAGAVVTTDELPVVVCDANQIGRVFQNLIGNAVKFRGAAPPEIHVGVRQVEQGWEFRVSDNGIGIAPEDGERAFKLFERLQGGERHSGTGMGLTISKRIVERHGGDIRIESTPGGGATVVFSLPRLEPTPRPD